MSFLSGFGKPTKKTLKDLIQGDCPVTLKDLLELDELQCRPDIVAAATKLLFDEKHSQEGYNILGPIAAEGDAEAQFIMGEFCEDALNRPEQAAIWFGRAADQGLAKAQRNYADILMAGKGISRDPVKAGGYYEKAAIAGIPEAQFVMGEFCRNGHFLQKDDAKAISWYRRSMEQGFEGAKTRLLQFYPDAMR